MTKEEYYKFKNKEFKDVISFLTEIHKKDFDKIKDEFIEVKCPINKFIESPDIYKTEEITINKIKLLRKESKCWSYYCPECKKQLLSINENFCSNCGVSFN